MRTAAIWLLMAAGMLAASAQEEEFGAAVKRSLDRSRILYPESAQPDSALSKAILARIRMAGKSQPCRLPRPKLAAASDCDRSRRPRDRSGTA